MRSTVKATLSVLAAGALLLGGAGTLAYWSDSETPSGETTVTSGELGLGTPACGLGWLLDDGAAFDPASDVVVPGDSLTRVCTMEITASGGHVTADLAADLPSVQDTGALDDELTVAAAWEIDTNATDGDPGASTETAITPADGSAWTFTDADDQKYLRVSLAVTFPFGVLDNDSNGAVSAVLDDLTVTATQTNDEHGP